MANGNKTITTETAYDAIEEAGISVWESDSGERRIYDPRKRGAYAWLEGGYKNADWDDYPEVKGGKCSGAFCAQLRDIVDTLKTGAL